MSVRSLVAIATLGLLVAAAAATSAITSDHITGKAPTIALAVPTGLAYIASGLVARARRPQNGTGALLILVGFAWFLAAFPTANNSIVFTAGLALTGVFIGFLAHLFLAYPSGKLGSRVDRAVTGAMYAVVCVLPLTILLFDETQISETACERGSCPENLLQVFAAQPVANVLAVVYALAAAALSLAVAVRLVRRWRHASPALRSALNPILVTAGVLISAFAAQVATGFFSQPLSRAINWFVLVAMLAVPLAFLYGLLRPRLTASTRRLAAELAELRRPEEVEQALRRALRDPTLQLGYASHDGYAGVDGRPLDLTGVRSGRALTPIGDGVIVHDASLSDQPELDEIVDAVRIAFERGLSLRSLEATEQRESALLDAVPDNVYRVSADGVFLEAHVKRTPENPNALVYPAGVTAERLIGRKIEDITPELSDRIYAAMRRALEAGEVVTIEYVIETPFGLRHAEERIVRSGPAETVGISRDVTERKNREAELTALSRVAIAVATEPDPQQVFNIVTEEVARVLGADGANLIRFDGDAEGVAIGQWRAEGARNVSLGVRLELDGPTPVALVQQTGKPQRMTSPETISGTAGERLRELGVKSAVAAPVHVAGRLWGAFVVSTREADAFPPDAEDRLEKFARLVAVAIGNTEARAELARVAAEQAALRRVAETVAAGGRQQRVFEVVTEEIGRLLGARIANLIRFDDDSDSGTVVGAWSDEPGPIIGVGVTVPFDGPTAVSRVFWTGDPAQVDDYEGIGGELAERVKATGVRSAVAAPIHALGRLWGAMVVSSVERAAFPPDAAAKMGEFARLVATALANAEARAQLAASRARIVRAGDEERRRLERNLHDGAQQRLVTLSLALRMAQAKLESDAGGTKAILESATEELAQALEELRELARGLHPAILSDRGLRPALEALAARAPVRVEMEEICADRLPPEVEAAAYYVVAESLTNVAKYAEAQAARVRIARRDGSAIVEVEDDGVGGADPARGTGLRGLADRVEALDGRFEIRSARGGGTLVRAELPA